jgi:hypothetical protein
MRERLTKPASKPLRHMSPVLAATDFRRLANPCIHYQNPFVFNLTMTLLILNGMRCESDTFLQRW